MGGNVKLGSIEPEPIKIEQRSHRAKDIHQALAKLNDLAGQKVFGPKHKALNSRTAYAGSTSHLMNPSLSDSELGKYKKSFSDIDAMIPTHQVDAVHKILQTNPQLGKFQVVGHKQFGPQTSVILKHADGQHHQLDLMHKPYDIKTDEPTDFSQFSHSSPIDDLKAGISGVMHKHLLGSVTAAVSQEGRVMKQVKDKVTYGAKEAVRPSTFSISHGLRAKHVAANDDKGQPMKIGGDPVYQEIDPKKATYSRNLRDIHTSLFGAEPQGDDLDKMKSFHGVSELIRKHLGHKQQENVIREFATRLFSKHHNIKLENDRGMKFKALDHLRTKLPEHFTPEFAREIERMANDHYKGVPLKESHVADNFHLAFAGGRFVGPTIEHQHLLERLFSQPADAHRVVVFGVMTEEETNDREPLTISEKIEILREAFPEHADCFIPADHPFLKTPNQALSWFYHEFENKAQHINLTIVAGAGDTGVVRSAGGSADSYRDIMTRLNESRFPNGVVRMDYDHWHIIDNPRGVISGTTVRTFIVNTPLNEDTLGRLKTMLHSGLSESTVQRFAQTVKRRSLLSRENLLING